MAIKNRPEFQKFIRRVEKSSDEFRASSTEKRHSKQYRTARENLAHLVDQDSFLEFGQFAVAAQRSRRDYEELQDKTNADGIITGFCSINSELVGSENSQAVAIVYDYSVLAGTQGAFHHLKLDRICDQAKKFELPIVIFTEGGGGRPGDTDVLIQIAGLHIPSFSTWAQLTGSSLKIAVNNGYCFAGNAALFGCSDFRIATKTSWIGMAGPAMIEGGGLGVFEPTDIGPVSVHEQNGVVDYVADNEEDATLIAKKLLAYFQGPINEFSVKDQEILRNIMPEDRRYTYEVRDIINTVADEDSFLELKKNYGQSIVTGFIRIEGQPFALLASDCQKLGGAIDSVSAEKAAEFISICNDHDLSILVPLVAIFLRKGYGLGAQALVGGSLHNPVYTAAWPTGEFGGMGIEGAVKLGYKKELESLEDPNERKELFDKLVAKMYEVGQAIEAASFLEIDAVIDPIETRNIVLKAFQSAQGNS